LLLFVCKYSLFGQKKEHLFPKTYNFLTDRQTISEGGRRRCSSPPAERVAFTDSTDWHVYSSNESKRQRYIQSGEEITGDGNTDIVAFRHGGCTLANVCFMDGHVSTTEHTELTPEYRWGGFHRNNF